MVPIVSESPTTETRVAEARNDEECPDDLGAEVAPASATPTNSSAATEPNAAKSPTLSTCRRDDSGGNEEDCMRANSASAARDDSQNSREIFYWGQRILDQGTVAGSRGQTGFGSVGSDRPGHSE